MNENSMNNAVTMRPQSGASLGRIDQYELIRELGGGGFGCVYLAKDTVAGIEVAVKGLPPLVRLNKEELENVRKNFALVSRLHHPNIAAALHLQKVEKALYDDKADAEKLRVFGGDTLVVMQYAPGVTLSQWRKQFPDGKVPFDKALEITRQIASALDYAHKEKILHRDIKPANVMIETGADDSLTARVLDFGLAAEIRSSMSRVSQSITDTSGTRPYMAPEQWLGEKQGFETDQYSLAVLFYELVTGEVPFASVFDTGDPALMMNVVGNREFNPPSELSKPIRLALSKALAKKREDRFASCFEFVEALQGGVISGARASSRAFFSRSAAILAAVAALGLAIGGVWYWQQGSSEPNGNTAREDAHRPLATSLREADSVRAIPPIDVQTEAEAERKAELEVFRLSSKTQSAHNLIDGESSEIKEFFAKEIRAFENDRRAGDDAKANSKYVIATNFYAQALMAATALKGSVTKYHECKELLPKIERAKDRADEVNAAESLPSGYRAAQEAQSVALAAFKAKRFDECKVKRQEAESLFASLRTDVITAVLDIADGHKNAERWDKCKQEAEKVLGWDANNPKALQLKTEAEKHLVPSLKVVTTIDGDEVRGAKVKINGEESTTPLKWEKLENGASVGPYDFTFTRYGKNYVGTLSRVTVNWLGLKTLTVTLKEYTGPRHGDRKTLRLPGGEKMTMIYVAPGSFMMGSPSSEEKRDDDETQHHVTLTKGYWLGESEVTQAQWESVMGSNPSHFKGALRPVEQVSWNDCQEFIAKIKSEARRQLGGEARLPTEAEWEYACRAGSIGRYAGTGRLDDMGWGNSGETHEVKGKNANAWGFYDMHGNVREWCQDWYGSDYYTSSSSADPKGPASGDSRVQRGGCSYDLVWHCRSAQRVGLRPGNRDYGYGFRLACSVGPQEKGDSVAREDARPPISQSVSKVQLWEGGPYWATKNIGAEKPEDYGYYFWWGDTVGYKQEDDNWVAVKGYNTKFPFSDNNVLTYSKNISELEREGWIEKKNGTYVLTSRHDAAQAHWGGAWRMPTKEEFDNLLSKCVWTETRRNGKFGYVVSGRGDYASKSIFLPAAGRGDGSWFNYADSAGHYWSSVPDSSGFMTAWALCFDWGRHYTYYYHSWRNHGQPVRPVQGFTK